MKAFSIAVSLTIATGWLIHATAPARAESDFTFRSGNEVVVRVDRLDALRRDHKQLTATVLLRGAGGEKSFRIDLQDRIVSDSLIFDTSGYGECASVELQVVDGAGRTLIDRRASPLPTIAVADSLAASGAVAAIERGSQLQGTDPRIALPDAASLRSEKLAAPTRRVTSAEITYPVIAPDDFAGSGSTNYVVVSRQSFAPADSSKCSLYFSYRKPTFDAATMKLKEWRKMLVEVPVDEAWATGSGDQTITLPLERFAIHTTEERERFGKRWNDPRGYNMLGGTSTGLFQGGQTAEVDDQGRIYITNVADGAGIVRFNPHTAGFEQPPLNLVEELRKFLPTGDEWKRSFDHDLAQVACAHGRVFIVFDRNYRVITSNGKFETCSGVVSLPQENWHDPEAFRAEIRLHAGCWPTAEFPLYDDVPQPGSVRKAGIPIATTLGIAFGTYQLDLNAAGRTERLARIKDLGAATDAGGRQLPPTRETLVKGLPRQRLINVGGAGRAFVRQNYGEFTISRAGAALTLPGAPPERLVNAQGRYASTFPDAPTGDVTVRFDLATKIKSDQARYGFLAAATAGPSQGPTYVVTPIPGEPDQAIAVCEYNYFYSKLDFSRRATERKVYKTFLPQASEGRATGFPLTVGLGPYNTAWVEHDDATWLYLAGYTGMSRLKYAERGRTLDGFTSEVFHNRLKPTPIDGVSRDNVKDFLHFVPAPDGRLIDIGRGRPGRGGGARSAGLEIFDPRTLGESRTAVEMNRCFGLYTPVSRIVFSTSGAPPRQELFVASGPIRPEYVADIDDPTKRPKNSEPKIFAYDCASGGDLRDLYGFSLPPQVGGRDAPCHIVPSPCRRFLVALQAGGAILTYHLTERRFVDGALLRTPADSPLVPLEFARPSTTLWTSPDGRIFFHTALDGSGAKTVDFFEVRVARDGCLSVSPHLSVVLGSTPGERKFDDIVRCFLADEKKRDGSYDLVLGSDQADGGNSMVRVIDDFVPPQTAEGKTP